MKTTKIAIALATTLAFTGLATMPASALTVSHHVVVATPAATIGTDDAVAIETYKTDNASYVAAVADFRTAKQSGSGAKAALKNAEKKYKAALKSYGNAKKVIGKTFRDSVASAKAVFLTENAAATNAEQKLAAKNKFASAKSQAASNRAAALTSLGKGPAKLKK
jgi:hypothetical protein